MKKLALFVLLIFGNLFLASTFSVHAQENVDEIEACARRMALVVAAAQRLPLPPDSPQAIQVWQKRFALPSPTELKDVKGWEEVPARQLLLPRFLGGLQKDLWEPWNTFLALLHKRKPDEDCLDPSSNLTQLRREQWLHALVKLHTHALLRTDLRRWNSAYLPMDQRTLVETNDSRRMQLLEEIERAETALKLSEAFFFYGSPNKALHEENMRSYTLFQRTFQAHLAIYLDMTGILSGLCAMVEKERQHLEDRLTRLMQRYVPHSSLMDNLHKRIRILEKNSETQTTVLKEQLTAERRARRALEKRLSELQERLTPFMRLLSSSAS